MDKVANEKEKSFVNVGPNLATYIKTQCALMWDGGSKILQSIYLGEVSEN